MALNFDSCFHLTQLAYPLLKASGRGNVVNISSIGGVGGISGLAHYASAKGTSALTIWRIQLIVFVKFKEMDILEYCSYY